MESSRERSEATNLRFARRILSWETRLHPRLFRFILRLAWPFLREKDGLVPAEYGPIQMRLDLLDTAERQIFLGVYDPPLCSLVSRFCRPGYTVIDVGSNVGIIGVTAARQVGSEGYVLLVEPNPVLCHRLRGLVERNPLRNLHVLEAAVGAQKGTLPFYISSAHTYSTLIKENLPDYPIDRVVQVQVLKLGEVFNQLPPGRSIHLLKVDAEGVDASIMLDALPGIQARAIDVIVVEALDERVNQVLDAYGQLHYSAHALHPGNHSLQPWGTIRSANDNLVLIRRGGAGETLLSRY